RFLPQVLFVPVEEDHRRFRALSEQTKELREAELGHSVRGGPATELPGDSTWRDGCRLILAAAQAGVAEEQRVGPAVGQLVNRGALEQGTFAEERMDLPFLRWSDGGHGGQLDDRHRSADGR